jgi:hypothetical protein
MSMKFTLAFMNFIKKSMKFILFQMNFILIFVKRTKDFIYLKMRTILARLEKTCRFILMHDKTGGVMGKGAHNSPLPLFMTYSFIYSTLSFAQREGLIKTTVQI